jgi:16S rRNA processing protein RimM
VYVLRTREREVLIPAIKPVVKEVNVQQRKMVIHVMEGLLE